MGMTNRQFDSHQKNLLRRLEFALEEFNTKGTVGELERIIQDVEDSLKRP